MGARKGRITDHPSSENGWRIGLEPEPERGEGEHLHYDWEEMVYTVVPEREPWPEVSEERVEKWWQLSRGPISGEETSDDALLLKLALGRERGGGLGFTAREMRMLEEIERLRTILDPNRERPRRTAGAGLCPAGGSQPRGERPSHGASRRLLKPAASSNRP
jgi:hypothetical protein